MEKTFTIRISDYWFGSTMAGRNTGHKIKQKIRPYFDMGIKTIMDFDGVENATHSFIDEIIWTFASEDFGKTISKIKVINANDDIKTSVKFVLADRTTRKTKT